MLPAYNVIILTGPAMTISLIFLIGKKMRNVRAERLGFRTEI